MLQLWKIGQSQACNFRAKIKIGTPFSIPLYLCAVCHNEAYTLRFLSSAVGKEDMSHQSNHSRGNGTFFPQCNIWHEDCAFLRNKIEIWLVHHVLGWWQRICRGDCFPLCGLWDTCVAMWRTVLAVQLEIANPLSLEMSCVAWPHTAQARTNHPPRSQALSLQYLLLHSSFYLKYIISEAISEYFHFKPSL